MGLVLATPAGEDPVLDTASHPELDPDTAARLASRPPVGEEDLIAMHRLLDGWSGDLRSLLGEERPGPDRGRIPPDPGGASR